MSRFEKKDAITVTLTTGELTQLVDLAADQLFRREFIDPKMPGHKPNGGEVSAGKALVARLRAILNPGAALRRPLPARNGKAAASAV